MKHTKKRIPLLLGWLFVGTALVASGCGGGSGSNGGGGGGNGGGGGGGGSQVVLRSISVSPTNPTIPMGGTQQFTATGTFSDNSTQTLTSVTWSSSATAVATISATGLVTAVAAGDTTVTATSASVSGTTTLTVTQLLPRFAYVANSGGTVSMYTVDAGTGQLRAHGYVLAGMGPNSVTVDPTGEFAYVANLVSRSPEADLVPLP